MHRIDMFSRAQRIVVVIGLALALMAVGRYLVTLGSQAGFSAGGGFSVTLGALQPGLKPWLRLIISLVLIAAWVLASVRVLRPSPEKTQPR